MDLDPETILAKKNFGLKKKKLWTGGMADRKFILYIIVKPYTNTRGHKVRRNKLRGLKMIKAKFWWRNPNQSKLPRNCIISLLLSKKVSNLTPPRRKKHSKRMPFVFVVASLSYVISGY